MCSVKQKWKTTTLCKRFELSIKFSKIVIRLAYHLFVFHIWFARLSRTMISFFLSIMSAHVRHTRRLHCCCCYGFDKKIICFSWSCQRSMIFFFSIFLSYFSFTIIWILNEIICFIFAFNCVFQINFLVCQILALFFASFFRSYLHTSKVTTNIRHAFGLTLGLYFGYFCFGQQAIHIAGLPAVCYIIIRTQNPQIVQR